MKKIYTHYLFIIFLIFNNSKESYAQLSFDQLCSDGIEHCHAKNYTQAITCFDQAQEYIPENYALMYNRAYARKQAGKMLESIPLYQKVITHEPYNTHAHIGYAQALLATGDLVQGFKELEWRMGGPQERTYHLKKKLKTGEDLLNSTIMICAEWGIGDLFQFIRYAQLLKDKGARIIVKLIHNNLVPLLSRLSFIDQLITSDEKNPLYDYEVPLMSLPILFETTLETVPLQKPYFTSSTELDRSWANYFDTHIGSQQLKVGLCWHGNPMHDPNKFIPLSQLIKITDLPGISFYSLQRNDGLEQLTKLSQIAPEQSRMLHLLPDTIDTVHGAFVDTASIIKNLDIIITVDTSIAHLAGALGKPVWLLVTNPGDWRWGTDQQTSPWYPTLQIFRQTVPHIWDNIIDQIKNKLLDLINTHKNYDINRLFTMAYTYNHTDRQENAVILYQEILRRDPNNAHAQRAISHAYLALGDYKRGWPAYEYRWTEPPYFVQEFKKYLTYTHDLKNKLVLIKGEYGLGDTLQFIRYAQQIQQMGATVIVEAQKSLVPLLELCPYIDTVVPFGTPPPPTHCITMVMSLPLLFDTQLDTIPVNIPYIFPDQRLVTFWKNYFEDRDTINHNTKQLRIGICWQSDTHVNSSLQEVKQDAYNKSIPLILCAQLAQTLNYQFYSLQKINGVDDIKNLPPKFSQFIHELPSLDTEHGPFMDTAAVMMNLDYIITIDTSVAHLSGALGRPTLLLLPYYADWRWLTPRSNPLYTPEIELTPWYPSVYIFRQKNPGDWDSVLKEVVLFLEKKIKYQ